MKSSLIVGLSGFAVILLTSHQAGAAGALAEGIAPGGVAKGYEIAYRVNQASAEQARSDALAQCKKGQERLASGRPPDAANARARARCAIVINFENKCLAVALDPKDATPGAGWATASTQKDADDEALARCRSVAGADRRDFCKVTNQACDGTAK